MSGNDSGDGVFVLENRQPLTVASGLLVNVWGGDGLIWGAGRWWEWDGGRWEEVKEGKVMQKALAWLGTVYYKQVGEGGERVLPLAPGIHEVKNTVEMVRVMRGVDWEKVPRWLDREEEGLVFGVEGGKVVKVRAEGVEVVEGGREWFDPGLVRCPWVEGAECPVWERCVEEWGQGDPAWRELLRRVMGYSLVGWRGFQRWALLEGVARGGKSTIVGVMRGLLGAGAVKSTSVGNLAGSFGLDGVQWARVLVVNECHEMTSGEGRAVGARIKEAVGEDPTAVNIKYQRQEQNVRLGVFPWVVANEMPVMPNKGDGMVSKMLVLPFRASFVGREDLGLEGKLRAEYPGILQWCVKGLRDAVAANPRERWPVPRAAEGMAREFRVRSSPLAAFIQMRFMEMENGFVSTEVVKAEWAEFVRAHRLSGEQARGYELLGRMREECPWPIRQGRQGGTGTRGLVGLVVRAEDAQT